MLFGPCFPPSKQQNRTRTTSSTVLGTPPNLTRTQKFPLEELSGGCCAGCNWESTEIGTFTAWNRTRNRTPPEVRWGAPNLLNSTRRSPKGWFPKGWFWRIFPGTKTGTRVHSDVPLECTTGTRVRSHVPPERKPERGHIRQNHPFTNPPFISR